MTSCTRSQAQAFADSNDGGRYGAFYGTPDCTAIRLVVVADHLRLGAWLTTAATC